MITLWGIGVLHVGVLPPSGWNRLVDDEFWRLILIFRLLPGFSTCMRRPPAYRNSFVSGLSSTQWYSNSTVSNVLGLWLARWLLLASGFHAVRHVRSSVSI